MVTPLKVADTNASIDCTESDEKLDEDSLNDQHRFGRNFQLLTNYLLEYTYILITCVLKYNDV